MKSQTKFRPLYWWPAVIMDKINEYFWFPEIFVNYRRNSVADAIRDARKRGINVHWMFRYLIDRTPPKIDEDTIY